MPASFAPSVILLSLLAGFQPEDGNEGYMRAAYQSAKAEEGLIANCAEGQFDDEMRHHRIQLQRIYSKLEQLFGADKARDWKRESEEAGSAELCQTAYRGAETVHTLGSIIDQLLHELEV
jgi:hypothetical protein